MFTQLSSRINMLTIHAKVANGSMRFDHPIQRGFVWELSRKRLLIHSLLAGYPVPDLYCIPLGDDVISILDGKQRLNTIYEFMSDKFDLSGTPDVTYNTGNGEITISLEKLKYSTLPEDLRNAFNATTCAMYTMQNMSDDEIHEMFRRLNNGRQLSNVDKARIRAKSLNELSELAKHEFFTQVFKPNAIESKTSLDVVMKLFVLLLDETTALNTNSISEVLAVTELTDDMATTISALLSYIYNVYSRIQSKKAKKAFTTKTDLLCLALVLNYARAEEKDLELVANWVTKFFDVPKGRSISEEYNENSTNHTTDKSAFSRRYAAMLNSFKAST